MCDNVVDLIQEKKCNNQEVTTLKNEVRQLKAHLLAKDAEIEALQEQLSRSGITDQTVQSEVFKLLGQLENEVCRSRYLDRVEAGRLLAEMGSGKDSARVRRSWSL